uniref:Uncharacterized protein n=1 Tax=viral metagenome TaxID=1070528 RepID=A0A6C0K8Z9_9ZZZZ
MNPYPSTAKKVWRKIRKTIIIDSRDRQVTTTSSPGNYTVIFPTVYSNIYSVTLRSYEVPFTYNQFAACQNNTSFSMTYNSSGGTITSTRTITIPDGNYTITTLPSFLTQNMNAAFGTTATRALNAYWNPTTGLASIYSTISGDSLSLNFSASQNINCGTGQGVSYSTGWGFGYFLGFYQSNYTSSNTPIITAGNTLSALTVANVTGNFIMNTNPDTYILMDIPGLNKIDETGIDGKYAGRIDGAFAKVPLTNNTGEYLFYQDTSGPSPLNQRVYNPPISKLDRITVRWRRHDGRIIDFNGGEHSFTLELELLDNNFDEYSSLDFSR